MVSPDQTMVMEWDRDHGEDQVSSSPSYDVCKRAMDFLISAIGLFLLMPLFAVVGVLIRLDSEGPVFFRQERIGKGCRTFRIFKFRTMHQRGGGVLTLGSKDPRVTRIGGILRKYKLDELPQLLNVLFGDMSLVGPRPEAMGFINLNDPRQRRVFAVLPGITAPSSLALFNLDEELASVENPTEVYRKKIIPMKIEMNLRYLEQRNLAFDLGLVMATLIKVVR